MIPYQPRRPAPWRTSDLIVIVLFYVAAQAAIVGAVEVVLGRDALRTPVAHRADKTDMSHILVQLMRGGDPWVLLLCEVSAVIVAPIFEEFFFRVLLQGWLEAMERRGRRRLPTLRRFMPHGFWPILVSAFLFARMHFRAGPPEINMKTFAWILAGDGAAKLLMSAFAVAWLRWHVGATAADFGWAPRKFFGDLRLGLAVFAVVAVPIYGLQIALGQLLPKYLAPDPFALFPLAVVLGALYYRTHRMAPSVAVHAALNATSVIVFLWFVV